MPRFFPILLTVILLHTETEPVHAQQKQWEVLLDTARFSSLHSKTSIPPWLIDDFDLDTQAMANPGERWNNKGIKDSSLRIQKLNWICQYAGAYYILSISAGGYRNNTVYILASVKPGSLIYIRNGTKSYSFPHFRRKFLNKTFKSL